MIGDGSSRVIRNAPTKNPSLLVPHVNDLVVFGDRNGSDSGWVLIVFSVESRVHGELSPEGQLSFPLVPFAKFHGRTSERPVGAHI